MKEVGEALINYHRKSCEKIGIDPDGRTAAWLREGNIDEDDAELIGFKTRYRHKFTNYNELFDKADTG